MVLPPGREPVAASGIDASIAPELAKAAGELNAWIDYLLRPESNDGPRIYRHRDPLYPENQVDTEVGGRSDYVDKRPNQYDTVSVLKNYAADPEVFFRPAQAVSGVSETIIQPTYDQLIHGFFTWTTDDGTTVESPLVSEPFPEMHPARDSWNFVIAPWVSSEKYLAYEYQEDFVRFSVYTESCHYVAAKHLARYRAIFQRAGEDIARLMSGLTGKFAAFDPPVRGEVSFDFLSIVVTGLVTATAAVITAGSGVTVGVVLAEVAINMIGEAVKTAKDGGSETKYELESRNHLREVAKQYLDGVNKIERDVAVAVKQLADSLRGELDTLRDQREYVLKKYGKETSRSVPHYRDYF